MDIQTAFNISFTTSSFHDENRGRGEPVARVPGDAVPGGMGGGRGMPLYALAYP